MDSSRETDSYSDMENQRPGGGEQPGSLPPRPLSPPSRPVGGASGHGLHPIQGSATARGRDTNLRRRIRTPALRRPVRKSPLLPFSIMATFTGDLFCPGVEFNTIQYLSAHAHLSRAQMSDAPRSAVCGVAVCIYDSGDTRSRVRHAILLEWVGGGGGGGQSLLLDNSCSTPYFFFLPIYPFFPFYNSSPYMFLC